MIDVVCKDTFGGRNTIGIHCNCSPAHKPRKCVLSVGQVRRSLARHGHFTCVLAHPLPYAQVLKRKCSLSYPRKFPELPLRRHHQAVVTVCLPTSRAFNRQAARRVCTQIVAVVGLRSPRAPAGPPRPLSQHPQRLSAWIGPLAEVKDDALTSSTVRSFLRLRAFGSQKSQIHSTHLYAGKKGPRRKASSNLYCSNCRLFRLKFI